MSRSHQCQGEVATRNTGTHPLGYGPAPSGYVPPQLEACLLSSLEAGSDALQPGAGTGLEYCAWGESQRSQTHISQQPGQGCLPESVWDQGRIKAWGSENGLHSPSVCMPVSATQAEGTPFQCKRPGDPGQGLLFAHPVAKNFHQPHWGNGPLAEWQKTEMDPRANRETELGTLSVMVGELAGRRSLWSLANAGAYYCRGLSRG